MTSITFIILVCLGPIAIMCEQSPWLPQSTIPYLAQQCLNLRRLFVGGCTVTPEVAETVPGYNNTEVCRSLNCAIPKRDGGHFLHRWGWPVDGTICGDSKVCREGNCIEIPAHHMPVWRGYNVTYDCRP